MASLVGEEEEEYDEEIGVSLSGGSFIRMQ